jgi:hypothetical protein
MVASLVATGTRFLVLDVKGLLAVMAFSAELALGHLAHVHFIRTLGHLEYLIVAIGTLEIFAGDVLLVAEDDVQSILGGEGKIAASDFLRNGAHRRRQADHDHGHSQEPLHP